MSHKIEEGFQMGIPGMLGDLFSSVRKGFQKGDNLLD